jgi:hypothetical protein
MNMDIKDLQNAVVYFSFTSKDGGEYAYLYMIVNHKFYWIDENYNVAEPLSQDDIDSYIQNIENDEYDEQYDLDSYDSIDDFLEEFGHDKEELVNEEAFEYPDYPSIIVEYVITDFVGEDKV